MASSHHGLDGPGYTHATMAGTEGGERKPIPETGCSPNGSLPLDSVESESQDKCPGLWLS